MLIEDILLLIIGGAAVFFLGIPFYKLINQLIPRKRNTLSEAKERNERAHLDAEAAKLDKETQQIYDHLYEDTLQEEEEEDETTENKHRRV